MPAIIIYTINAGTLNTLGFCGTKTLIQNLQQKIQDQDVVIKDQDTKLQRYLFY